MKEAVNKGDFFAITKKIYNWARWSRLGRCGGHCASAEHRYTAPREDNGVNSRADWMPIDRFDAEVMDDAIRMLCDPTDVQFLDHKFVEGNNDRHLCDRFRVRFRDLGSHLARIVGEVDGHYQTASDVRRTMPQLRAPRQLANLKSLRYKSRQIIDLPSSDATGSLLAAAPTPKEIPNPA